MLSSEEGEEDEEQEVSVSGDEGTANVFFFGETFPQFTVPPPGDGG